MGYSGHNATPSRSLFVIIGGMLAWAGLTGGAMIATPEYHRALTMKEEPVEMTWHELVENGLTDNSYVHLIDVELDDTNQLGVFEDMLMEFDAEVPAEDRQAAFTAAADNVDLGQIAETAVSPIKVCPKGQDPSKVPVRIVVPLTPWATQAAYEEVEASGTLTGRFTLREDDGFEMQLTPALLAGTDAANNERTDRNHDLQGNAEARDNAGVCWVFEPVHDVPSLADTRQWFWLSGLAVAVGLVICGSGGPSLACCIFFQCPSLLSMLGYPMRYGRPEKTTRIVYAAIGTGLIIYGYQKMIVEAHFGQVNGDIALAILGFLAGSVGAAALLGSITSVVAQRMNVSLQTQTPKKNSEPTMSYTQACSLEPPKACATAGYAEPELVSADDVQISGAMRTIAQSLATLGFGDPLRVAWLNGEDRKPALIQLGCQEMVVADVDETDGATKGRLVSVLHDGIVIVTLSRTSPSQSSMRFGTNGLYSVSESDDPKAMLSSHLNRTASMAEKRDTSVVTIEATEVTDVVLHARRVLADIRSQYGEETSEVGDSRYGRFCFPVAPVAQLDAV
jgi:hypothetical protein